MPKPISKGVAVVVVAAVLLLAGIYASGYPLPGLIGGTGGGNDSPDAVDSASTRVLPVNTLVAKSTSSYEQKRLLTGIVRARRSGDLSFSQAGRLNRLLVDQGEKVLAGDPLAEMDASRLAGQKNQLETARERANAKLAKLIADSRLRSMEAIRVEVRALRSQLNQLREEVNRDTAPSTQARVDDAQRRLDALESTSGDREVVEHQGEIRTLSEQIAQLENEIEKHTLRAPYDGVIAHRYVSDGVLVSPSVPIMRIVESDALEVWFGLPADAANDLTVGETHMIDIGEQEFEAAALAKLPELDQTTRTRTVVFSLDASASSQILSGEVARIELSRSVEEAGFWLPMTSLTREARGLWSVYELVRNDRGDLIVSRQYVEVMHLQGETARVRGTLDDGALVIADGTHRVVPGQVVTTLSTARIRGAESGNGEAERNDWGVEVGPEP